MDIDALNIQHGLGEELVFSKHPSGLVLGKVKTNACTGEFFLQGAHVTQYQDLLFMSSQAVFEQGKPLRGGIPICFPWFSSHPQNPSLPAHGWARTSTWKILRTFRTESAIAIELGLSQEGFQLVYKIRMGNSLNVALEVSNASTTILDFEVALHSYFHVGNIDQVSIAGDLEGCEFHDQLSKTDHPAQQQPIGFTQETDRIYYGAAPKITIQDPSLARAIDVESQGSQATVVWNPWIDKSKRMSDFGDLEYRNMCCVETANIRRCNIQLHPGQTHTTSSKLSVRSVLFVRSDRSD